MIAKKNKNICIPRELRPFLGGSTLFPGECALLLGELGPFPQRKFIAPWGSCIFH